MRDYNYRMNVKEKEKKAHMFHYNKYVCRPRSPRIQTDPKGSKYIVEGNPDQRKRFLKKQASKKARRNKNLSSGSCYKKIYALIYEWY